jgi:hypothetical protein
MGLRKFVDDMRVELAENPFISQNEARTAIRNGIASKLSDTLRYLGGIRSQSEEERAEVSEIAEEIADLRREAHNEEEYNELLARDSDRNTYRSASRQLKGLTKFVDDMRRELAKIHS